MKKLIFAVFIVFTFALLMGGTCGPQEDEIPVDEPATDTGPTDTDQDMDEPDVPDRPEVEPLEEGDFRKAYFDFDKYNIRRDAQQALEHNADLLKDNPDVRILIEGHCDERGTVEYNIALGERRANSCKDYLAQLGIDRNRMETISYGKERPVALGHNEEAWQKNRRAEFRIIEQ